MQVFGYDKKLTRGRKLSKQHTRRRRNTRRKHSIKKDRDQESGRQHGRFSHMIPFVSVARRESKHVKEFGWSHLHFKDFSSAELFCSMIRKKEGSLWMHASNESIRRHYTEN
jgi:hypothetical protein